MKHRNWKKWNLILVVILVLIAMPAKQVFAEEATDAKIERLEETLLKLQKEIEQLKQEKTDRQSVDKQEVEQVVNEVIEEKDKQKIAQTPELPRWLETFRLSGDFRFRHEYTDDATKNNTRNRNRIRARLRMDTEINDEFDVTFRIATGDSDSPTSTNQTLGDDDSDGFSSKDLWLDWAYADWHPDWLPNTNIILGKMPVIFYKAGKNQLIWDSDLSIEGIGVKHKMELTDATDLHINGGGFWVKEDSGNDDISLWGLQGYVDHDFANDTSLIAGASIYDYGNLKGNSVSGFDPKGNSVTTVGSTDFYDNDYNIFETFGEYKFTALSMPMSFYGSYVNNLAVSNEDTGWIVGTKLNKAKAVGTWQLSYDYRDIEADAVVGGLNSSDFVGGGTNAKGHKFGGKYQLSENTQLGLTYFMAEKNANSTQDDYDSLFADLVFKF